MRAPAIRAAAAAALLAATAAAAAAAGEVNVYSYRQPFLVKPLFDAFTERTGIPVNVVFAKTGLVKRLEAEGRNSPADLVFTVDIARLAEVVDAGLSQPVRSAALERAIPGRYRDPEGRWFGLTYRARVVYASRERVPRGSVSSYEQLADPRWRGRLCSRKGDHPYNVALLAAMISRHGEERAEGWLRGVKANLARKPQGNDRAQVKAIMEGVCDLAVGNHYYMALMADNPRQRPWADSAYIVFPTLGGDGTHVNVSGMTMTRNAPNRGEAVRLMEFLASPAGQRIYASENFEYPIDPSVPPAPLVASWGAFPPSPTPLATIAANRPAALRMVNRLGFNDGPAIN